MHKNYLSYIKLRGTSLLEIMFAMSIGLLILGLLLSIYQTSQKSMRLQQALSQLEDHASFTLALLTTEIKQAGQRGCIRADLKNNLSGTAHNITISYARSGPILITKMLNNTEMLVSREPRLAVGNQVMIANCVTAETAKILYVYQEKNYQRIVLAQPLKHRFAKYAEVGVLTRTNYFIRNTQRHNKDGSSIYALFSNQNGRNAELVTGINTMQFTYTIKQNNIVRDVEAVNIRDWSQVVGVGIQFLLSAPPFKREAYAYIVLNA